MFFTGALFVLECKMRTRGSINVHVIYSSDHAACLPDAFVLRVDRNGVPSMVRCKKSGQCSKFFSCKFSTCMNTVFMCTRVSGAVFSQ